MRIEPGTTVVHTQDPKINGFVLTPVHRTNRCYVVTDTNQVYSVPYDSLKATGSVKSETFKNAQISLSKYLISDTPCSNKALNFDVKNRVATLSRVIRSKLEIEPSIEHTTLLVSKSYKLSKLINDLTGYYPGNVNRGEIAFRLTDAELDKVLTALEAL